MVRLLSADAVPVRDLPTRSGVSKEAITAAVGFPNAMGMPRSSPIPPVVPSWSG